MTAKEEEISGKTVAQSNASLRRKIRNILYSYPLCVDLSDKDFEFMKSILEMHERADQKIGCGVVSISVRPSRHGTLCFWLTRADGTSTDFSYIACLKNRSHLVEFKMACRNSVIQDVMKFREVFFQDNEIPICPLSGIALTNENSHVDHVAPQTFDSIIEEFVLLNRIDIDSVLIAGKEDGEVYLEFADKDMKEKFRDYHNSVAVLRVVSAKSNLSIGGKNGLKKS